MVKRLQSLKIVSNCEKESKRKENIKVEGKWKFETESGDYKVNGNIVYSDISEEGAKGNQNFFLFDGKPIGYRSGDIFEVVAKELAKRNLKEVGGIVICDADDLHTQPGKVVQILSEEYEASYYKRIKNDDNKVVNLKDLDPDVKVVLDDQVVPAEILKQIDPKEIATINILGGEKITTPSSEVETGPVVVIRTKINVDKLKVKTSFDFDKKIDLSPEMDLKLKVSPNPSAGIFNINFELERKEKITVKIINLIGQTVDKIPAKTYDAGLQKITWDGTQIVNGYYFLQLETKTGITSVARIELRK